MGNLIASRLPTRAEVFPVFSVITFFVYSWALYRMFWYVPSWLEYLSIGSIFIMAAYTLAFALFESLAVTGLVLLLCLVLPAGSFRRCFVAQGVTLALAWSAAAILIQRQVNIIQRLEIWQALGGLAAALAASLLLILFSGWLFRRFGQLQRLAEAIGERMTIFTMLYVPLGILGLGVVLVRNLF